MAHGWQASLVLGTLVLAVLGDRLEDERDDGDDDGQHDEGRNDVGRGRRRRLVEHRLRIAAINSAPVVTTCWLFWSTFAFATVLVFTTGWLSAGGER